MCNRLVPAALYRGEARQGAAAARETLPHHPFYWGVGWGAAGQRCWSGVRRNRTVQTNRNQDARLAGQAVYPP